jgi:serine/threonine protein kinase
VPYIAMQLVEGESLDFRIASARSDCDTSGLTCITLGDFTDLEDEDGANEEDAPKEGRSASTSSQVAHRERAAILQTVGLFEIVARTLHYAHQRGVVHRDLKPANIMITPQGQPILMDFDMARDDRERDPALTRTGDCFGSPAYVPPEVLRGDARSLDARGDIWALGVSLFEAISLERPFVASTREGLYQAILTREPRNLRDLQPACPPDLWVVIRRTLEKEREDRFATAEEFADELARVLRDEPVLSHPHSPVSAAWRWVRRHPWRCATFALAGTVLGLLGWIVRLARA